MNKGFTLIEILVVASITGIISTLMLLNFQRTRVDLNDSGSGLKIRCGYGVHYVNPTSYSIYAGPDASSADCSSFDRNLDDGDATVATKVFGNQKVEFKAVFNDIFWEPPHPYTYINNA